jgi:hypothetical protein
LNKVRIWLSLKLFILLFKILNWERIESKFLLWRSLQCFTEDNFKANWKVINKWKLTWQYVLILLLAIFSICPFQSWLLQMMCPGCSFFSFGSNKFIHSFFLKFWYVTLRISFSFTSIQNFFFSLSLFVCAIYCDPICSTCVWFHQHFTSSFCMSRTQKDTDDLTVFFALLLGSALVKDVLKTLMKLTPRVNVTNLFRHSFLARKSQKCKNSVKLSISFCAFGICV